MDLVTQLGVDPSQGLTRDEAMQRRSLYGANRVTPPVNCPSWVCCLLPCLLRTSSMKAYHAALPTDARVRRRFGNTTRSLRMDATSLVYGDIVQLEVGDVVAADLRVLECSPDCVVDQMPLVGENEEDDEEDGAPSRVRKHLSVEPPAASSSTSIEEALLNTNVVLTTSRVVSGTALGIVIATGNATVWGRLLADHQWPVEPSSGKRRKGEEHALMRS